MPLFVGCLAALIILGILYPLFLYRRRYGTWRYWRDLGLIQYRPAARCPQCGHIQKLHEAGELATARCEVCGAGLAR